MRLPHTMRIPYNTLLPNTMRLSNRKAASDNEGASCNGVTGAFIISLVEEPLKSRFYDLVTNLYNGF